MDSKQKALWSKKRISEAAWNQFRFYLTKVRTYMWQEKIWFQGDQLGVATTFLIVPSSENAYQVFMSLFSLNSAGFVHSTSKSYGKESNASWPHKPDLGRNIHTFVRPGLPPASGAQIDHGQNPITMDTMSSKQFKHKHNLLNCLLPFMSWYVQRSSGVTAWPVSISLLFVFRQHFWRRTIISSFCRPSLRQVRCIPFSRVSFWPFKTPIITNLWLLGICLYLPPIAFRNCSKHSLSQPLRQKR